MSNDLMSEADKALAALKAEKELQLQNKANGLVISKKKTKESVTIAVDLSGSMGINFFHLTRAEAAKQAMDTIINQSSSKETQYGLVSFTHEAYEILEMGTMFGMFLATKFHPTGGTNMYEALRLCLKQDPNRVIILSDGATIYQAECLRLAQTEYVTRKVKIDTIAIGEADDRFMMDLSESTGGKFKRCDTPEKLNEAFAQLETRAYLQLEHK